VLDASPPTVTALRAPGWFGRLLHLDLAEARTEISAKPNVYGVLAVMPSSDAVTPAPTPAVRPLRVLIAEDSSVNQRVARGLLERQGHRPAGML
jgi:hypothetical protein